MLTGSGTVLADDPQLTVRQIDGQPWHQVCATNRQPLRIVLDSQLQTPPHAKIFDTPGVLLVHADASADRIAAVEARGAECLALPGSDGHIDLAAWMLEMGRRQFNEVTVEAGARLNGALWQAGLVDEVLLYQAPVLLGDTARGMLQFDLADLSQKRALNVVDQRRIGPDWRCLLRGE
jgi:diaminohydroxyphosphoribosylaminopyrimidine deaminase/5-amino-6-(5-phosphoribosylamino)uracil reductase